MTPVDKRYVLYDIQNLHIVRASPVMSSDITAFVISGSMEYVGLQDGTVHAFLCGSPMWSGIHSDSVPIIFVLISKDSELITIARDNSVCVWTAREGSVCRRFVLDADAKYVSSGIGFTGELLVGTASGDLEIWDMQAGVCGYCERANACGGAITTIATCPYSADVIALGTSQGTVILYHLSDKVELMKFDHSDKAALCSLSFGHETTNLLVSATTSGSVVVWDLNEGMFRCFLQKPSESMGNDTVGPAYAQFLGEEPIIVTAGADNSIRVYQFDETDLQGSIIRSKEGHANDCILAEFIDEERIISGGLDRTLRMCHVFSDSLALSLSQGKMGKLSKRTMCSVQDLLLPPVTSLSYCTPRKSDWSSIVTTHEGSNIARTWRMDNLALTKIQLVLTKVAVRARISRCGHLAVVADDDGGVHIYYLQEGKLRSSVEKAMPSQLSNMHISGCNSRIIALSKCGSIVIIGLFTGDVQRKFRTTAHGFSPHSALHLDSHLLCVGTTTGSIEVYGVAPEVKDARELQPVRKFHGHTVPLVALVLEPSTQRYLISSSMRSELAVWDLVMECCVATFTFSHPVTSLSYDPSGRFFSTTHAGHRGVFVWTSMVKYGPSTTNVLEKETYKSEPTLKRKDFGGNSAIQLTRDSWSFTKQFLVEETCAAQAPLFKARQIGVPFYLESASGDARHTKKLHNPENTEDVQKSFERLLCQGDFTEMQKVMEKITPTEAIMEFETILSTDADSVDEESSPESGEESGDAAYMIEQTHLLLQALKFFLHCLQSRRDVDRTQVLLSLFMKAHASKILRVKSDMHETLSGIFAQQSALNAKLSDLCNPSSALLNLIKRK